MLRAKQLMLNPNRFVWKNIICHEQEEARNNVDFFCLIYENVWTWNTCGNGNAVMSHLLPFPPKALRRERSPHLLGRQVWNTAGLIPGFLGWKGKTWDIPLAAEEFTWICSARLQRQWTVVMQHQTWCSSPRSGTPSRERRQKKG